MSGRCRHNGTWLVANGLHEWCYECGALRRLREVRLGQLEATTQWTRPVGVGGANPYPMRPKMPAKAEGR